MSISLRTGHIVLGVTPRTARCSPLLPPHPSHPRRSHTPTEYQVEGADKLRTHSFALALAPYVNGTSPLMIWFACFDARDPMMKNIDTQTMNVVPSGFHFARTHLCRSHAVSFLRDEKTKRMRKRMKFLENYVRGRFVVMLTFQPRASSRARTVAASLST